MPDLDTINQILTRPDPALWLLTAQAAGERGGLIATFVSTASIVPTMPRVLVGLAKQHHTWHIVGRSGAFVLHLLAEEQLDWVWRFGLQSGREMDKFAGLTVAPDRLRLLEAPAWLDCRVEATLDIGDRTLYVAEVRDGGRERDVAPLTMRRVLELAPAERLRELKAGLVRDAVVDAAAIAAWRAI